MVDVKYSPARVVQDIRLLDGSLRLQGDQRRGIDQGHTYFTTEAPFARGDPRMLK